MIRLLCFLLFVAACGKGDDATAPAKRELLVRSATAGTGADAGRVRLEIEVPGETVKSVKVNGAAGQPGSMGAFWAPLPEPMRKPGKHSLQIEAALYPKGNRTQAAPVSTTYTLEVPAPIPTVAVAAVRGTDAKARTLTCYGCVESKTSIAVGAGGTVEFDITTAAGNEIDWNGEKTTSTGAARRVSMRVAERFGDAPTANLWEHGFKLPLQVKNADGGTSSGGRIAGNDAASTVFAPLATGQPVTFGAADIAVGPPKSLLIVPNTNEMKVEVIGTASKVRDVDLVALALIGETSRVSCGKYTKGGKAGGGEGFLIVAMDVTMEVYDRRAGRKLGAKNFAAPRATCPSAIMAGQAAQFTTGDKAAALAFAMSFLKP